MRKRKKKKQYLLRVTFLVRIYLPGIWIPCYY